MRTQAWKIHTKDSVGSNNATSLKDSPGTIAEISIINNAAYPVYLKLFNKASAPTVGTDIAYRVIAVAASSHAVVNYDNGAYFSTGIAYAITKSIAYNDNTAVLSHDAQLTIQYI